jgi:gamma-glutamyltranspeptidase / glutathione hydrolase
MRWRSATQAGGLALLISACAQTSVPVQPEAASGWTTQAGWTAQRFMVAAANPLATVAGYDILRAGGSALDAAIAVQLVLTLVEPQSSGIGGGAFLMHADGREGRGGDTSVQAWDGRETAPAASDARLFLGTNGKPVPYAQAVFGGRAVATPGVLKMLQAAHQVHGQLPWARLFDGAIELAERGFAISPRLHSLLAGDPALRRDALARAFFYQADGQAKAVGQVLRNPALAAIYRRLAQEGSGAFYGGAIAADLVARVQNHDVPGRLSLADLAAYTPLLRTPMCTDWTVAYRVCGFPPPSSGHIAIMQTLGTLALLPVALQAAPLGAARLQAAPLQAAPLQAGAAAAALVPSADWLHTYIEATRLAYADRALFVADPSFVSAPGGDWHHLLSPNYLARRAALIGPRSMKEAPAGDPGAVPVAHAPMPEQIEHGTSHISVVDAQGRVVAMTSSIEAGFGARVMADGGTGLPGGYLLNNQMTDFSLAPMDSLGRPVANRIEPGKRPRSSMSPTLVLERADATGRGAAFAGRVVMTVGSPGGPVIIAFTAKALLGTLQWGLDPQRAIELPNFAHLGGAGNPVLLEAGRFPPAHVSALQARGHTVAEVDLPSGLQAIRRTASGWQGGADPRREGIARGD